ncbi:MAG: cyclase family protein [Deltaproteobacteria bacterium]|jgi:kynurenine formamidase|nr:cyclase family protein [Deltaproteobacteria bacterium]
MSSLWHEKFELIDLSQDIYEGMPVFGMHQKTFVMINQTHEENMKATGSKTLGFSARNLLMSEHGPTHSDAIWEFKPDGPTIDQMDLKLFWGEGICVDVSHIKYPNYIEIDDFKEQLTKTGLEIKPGDIFLMYTGHFERTYPDRGYGGPEARHSGVNFASAEWLFRQGVVNLGVDAPAIDLTPDDLDYSGHRACGQYGATNTENLCNLDRLVGRRFLYMGLPLKIRAGSGSPIRAVALLPKN